MNRVYLRHIVMVFMLCAVPMRAHAQLLTGYDRPSVPSVTPASLTGPAASPLSMMQKIEALPEGDPALSSEPVDLQADNLVHDDAEQTVTASGDVFLTQAGRILRADKISYNLAQDTVVASGHVVLNEENGDIHYSEEVKFNDKLKNGFVKGLKSYLQDGARFTAEEGERKNGNKTTMHDATYTPCEPCKANPEKAPAWQIHASEVTHDEQERRISYRNARFEVRGVPVAYIPYFSHPDGTIKRKSGLLSPSAGFKSDLGGFVENSYYWNIGPDKDATIGVMAMTKENPLATAQWRQRWESASLELEGGITESGRTESRAGVETKLDEELRGHILGQGLWNIDDKWRSGLNVEWASDDQYMRQYDFSNEDVLTNELYLERFSGRNYAVGRVLSFQDVRVSEERADQPKVLPEVNVSFLGEPNAVPVIGGRWSLDGSMLGLERNGNKQDMNRFSLTGGWERRLVSDYGLLTNVEAGLRGDIYNTRDRDIATPGSGRSRQSSAARLFPNMHIQSSYPMVREYETMQAVVQPVIALTVAPDIEVDSNIPNEDSNDVQIDAGNIFEPNRFPGHDRIEDRSRITYGMRTGLYGYEGSHGDIFLGQSYRLSDKDNPFPEGSGLDRQESDIVGQLTGQYKSKYGLNYRFQFASDDFTSQRHEVDTYASLKRFTLSARYLFAKALEGTDIDESREQVQAAAGYYLTEDWRYRIGATQDLGDAPGLRRAFTGIDYFGQCYSLSLTGHRNFTNDSSGESDTEIVFRVGLKNLGEYESSALRNREAID